MEATSLYQRLQQQHFFGYLTDEEYRMLLTAFNNENCKLKMDTVHGKEGALVIRWEIRFVREFNVGD